MSISVYLEPIANCEQLIKELLVSEFKIDLPTANIYYSQYIKKHIDKLNDSTYLVAETNYVDKVYRDSYYHYFSSKLNNYQRDCIRISIFEGKVEENDFNDEIKIVNLQKNYRGFFTLRPTIPIIGRSIISPKALKENDFLCCTSVFDTTANGIKFEVEGFPHSSQDTETMSCAETTLWAVMEYFSNKYANYIPVLPSKIIQTLNKVSSERQIPSKGLNIAQMSFALKEFGFGTRIYSKTQYGNDFFSLFNCYIESGIPLIVAMENRSAGGNIGHAILAIGHKQLTDNAIDTLSPISPNQQLQLQINRKNLTFYDYNQGDWNIVFIDDNNPIYQIALSSKPALHYNVNWHSCQITNFIVPLYPKIYLEAFEAKNYILRFLITGPVPINDGSEILLKYYLTSSRSYKDNCAKNPSLSPDLKSLILESSLPKFVWVAEITDKRLIKDKKAKGLILLDATEANIFFNKPLILAAYQDTYLFFNNSGILEKIPLHLQEFNIFENNLKSFTND